MADDYRAALASCAATQSCDDLASSLFRGDGAIMDLVDFTLVVPLLFGLFWGAPLLAKEFEDGTHNLAWTQGVSRWRWIRVNIAWSLLAAAVWGAAIAALVSWWRYPENALHSRFDAFDVQGIVPVAYALFAVALGIAVGSVIRRDPAEPRRHPGDLRRPPGGDRRVPAPALPGAGHEGVPTPRARRRPRGAWMLSQGLVSPTGKSLGPGIEFSQFPAACQTAPPGGKGLLGQCLASHGFRQMLTYQPASRFWAFQGIEAGIFVMLAAALTGFAIWWVLGHDA